MVRITKSKIIEKVNNSIFRKKLLTYLKKNKCCTNINCDHPPYQSDPYIHKHFKIFEKAIEKELKAEVIKLWIYYTKKNQIVEENWHTHGHDHSCLLYLTDSNFGTIFPDFKIPARKNHWVIWNKDISHTTEACINNKDRLIVAGNFRK